MYMVVEQERYVISVGIGHGFCIINLVTTAVRLRGLIVMLRLVSRASVSL